MNEMLFKVLNEDGSAYHGGSGNWHLPSDDGTPGEWMPSIEGELIACVNGYHLCRAGDLVDWLGPAIFEAGFRGERIDTSNKVIVREARLLRLLNWDEKTARLFACDCAERVLHIFEENCPQDNRPRRVIDTARRHANGEATTEELAAAWAATRGAAWDAESDAESDAVRVAARVAAWGAAWDAARDAARDAALVAARDAAMDAVKAAAWDAVWDAAWAVVWGDARAAARAAERSWQTTRLLKCLNSTPNRHDDR